MIVSEAANRVLVFLEQADEEEYTRLQAIEHVIQALHELAEENEFKYYNNVINFPLLTEASFISDSGNLSLGIPGYWATLPGRALLTTVLSTTWNQFSYIKRGWLSVDGQTMPFMERTFEEIMDTFGDEEGIPESFAINGEYIIWRPIAPSGSSYTARFLWQRMPPDATETDEPLMLAQCPYGVIYRACMIASVWLLDDNRVPMFKALSENAFERYNIRQSMMGDSPRSMGEFNG